MTMTPKPGPVTPIRAVPVRDHAPGLNDGAAEARRRIVQMLLPFYRDVDDLLTVAAWIEHGDDEEAGT